MPDYPAVLQQFGDSLVARNFGSAQACLAPWLAERLNTTQLEEAIARALDYAADCSGVESPAWPESFTLDQNEIALDDLRMDMAAMPAEVTPSNFVGWYCLEFGAEADDGTPFDLWTAVVREKDGAERLGHIEFVGAD
jgi:hypothetical protein